MSQQDDQDNNDNSNNSSTNDTFINEIDLFEVNNVLIEVSLM